MKNVCFTHNRHEHCGVSHIPRIAFSDVKTEGVKRTSPVLATLTFLIASMSLCAPCVPATPAAAAAIPPSDWPQFGRDVQRTGNNPGQTLITAANVQTLKVRWIASTFGVRRAEPVVVDGAVFGVDNGGVIRAYNEKSGTLKWSYLTLPPGDIRGTPAVIDGVLYVGSFSSAIGGRLYALDAVTGQLRWSFQLSDVNSTFSGSPLIDTDQIYLGEAVRTEAENSCDRGQQLVVFPTAGTAPTASLDLTVPPQQGADIWTAPMMDPSGSVYVGTGNACNETPTPNAQAIIKVRPVAEGTGSSLALVWRFIADKNVGDIDMMGPIYANGMVVAGSKNGFLYAIDAATGRLLWSTKLGYQILSTPAFDGSQIYATVDYARPFPCDPGSVCGAVVAVGLNGVVHWSIPTHRSAEHPHSGAFNSPTVSNGLVFVAYDDGISALDSKDGTVRWRYQTGTDFFSRATIVQGGLFIGDFTGHLYCFTPGGN
jgi:outer membrane protein assembly factor BamB